MDKILLVDDEPKVLSGLRRMLYHLNKQWEIMTANGGKEALATLQQKHVDIVISDMRMPSMNGLEFLTQVKQHYPGTIRIILSGHSDKELILKSVNVAHQYLAKPCTAETIKNVINRSHNIKNILQGNKIITSVTSMHHLPSLPELYTDILEELHRKEPSIEKIASIISEDISMSAKILQLVNSAFFGIPRHITSINNAVKLLGLETITSLVLSIKIFTQFGQKEIEHLQIRKIWSHCLRTSKFAQNIAQKSGHDNMLMDNTFIAGMLHDIGKLVLAKNYDSQYSRLIQNCENDADSLYQLEQKTFGINHASVGAYLLGLWGFPFPVIEAVAFHHEPELSNFYNPSPLLYLYIANIIDFSYKNTTAIAENSDYLTKISCDIDISQIQQSYIQFFSKKEQ